MRLPYAHRSRVAELRRHVATARAPAATVLGDSDRQSAVGRRHRALCARNAHGQSDARGAAWYHGLDTRRGQARRPQPATNPGTWRGTEWRALTRRISPLFLFTRRLRIAR